MAGQGTGQPEKGSLLAQLSEGLADVVARAGAATVRVEARRRLGASGVLWSADGLVVTADHIIEREEDIVVGLADGRELRATLVGRDPGSDLALLKVAEQGLPAAAVAANGELSVGHLVLALGRPGEGGVTATMGIVSLIGGPWRSRRGGMVEGYIRTDVTMYPGYSGGPLVNTAGRVVGVNSSLLGHGMSLAIPAASVSRVVEALRQQGRVKQGYLGVRTQPVALPAALAQQLGQQSGLLVMGVEPEGPADRGGVLLGDILVGLAGQPVRDIDELQALLGPDRVGTAVPATVVRGGERRELSVTIGERQ